MGMIIYVILSYCFCWIWLVLACIWTKCVWWSQTTLLPLFVNSFCNNYVNSDVWGTCEMDVTCGLLCWITMILVECKLVWNPSWFQLTTGFIWVQVWRLDHSGDCFRTCALINWSVLLQLASEQDSTLNMSYVYLKQRFCLRKSVLTTYSYLYIGVFKSEILLKCASGHILYAQIRTFRWLI